jgi:hypothetical protein
VKISPPREKSREIFTSHEKNREIFTGFSRRFQITLRHASCCRTPYAKGRENFHENHDKPPTRNFCRLAPIENFNITTKNIN